MSLLFHQTPAILIRPIMEAGLTYKKRNYGIFCHPETEAMNHLINQHRPQHIHLDRNECVFFTFKRDYIKYGFSNPGVMVNSNNLNKSKMWCFSLTISTTIRNRLDTGDEDNEIPNLLDIYWKSMIPFEYFDQNYQAIEDRWRMMFLGHRDPEYCAEVLYFDEVSPQYLKPIYSWEE